MRAAGRSDRLPHAGVVVDVGTVGILIQENLGPRRRHRQGQDRRDIGQRDCRNSRRPVKKRRYATGGGLLDLYTSPHAGLAVFEVSFESEAIATGYTPPNFVRDEVTQETRYSGASLA